MKLFGEKERSLRTRIATMMSFLVAMQSVALIVALFVSQVFLALDMEAFRQFENTAAVRAEKYNESTNVLMGNTAKAATKLADQLEILAASDGLKAEELYQSDSLYEAATLQSTELITRFLRDNNVTGGFVIFNGSNVEKTLGQHHSAVYIRNTSPDTATSDNNNYQIEIGPAMLSKEYGIHIGPNWDIGITFDDINRHRQNYYYKPIEASQDYKKSEIERYGYWSTPLKMLAKDRDQAIAYSMPLLDEDGEAFGVFGAEISLPYITRYYLPDTDLPYNNSFFAIAEMSDSQSLDLEWFIPSGPVPQVYLDQANTLSLKEVRSYNFSQTQVPGLGDMYTYLSPLNIYSDNSPFADDEWTMTAFVAKDELHETSKNVRNILIGSISVTTVVAFVAVFILSSVSTRQIIRLPEDVRKFDPYRDESFEKTGLREIDELTSAVEVLSKSVVSASKTTSKIMELTSMPLGGYEVIEGNQFVTVTDYVRQLMNRGRDDAITRDQWDEFYKILVNEPIEQENTYIFNKQKNEKKYLRIQQAETNTGYVGTVLDVTEDIEKTQQLARELDHDSLTHLYNRTAFKRRSYDLIREQPGKKGAMIFADLDNLKYINDSFGHDAGDRFLIRAGDMFDQFSKHGAIVSRISGDEFAIYIHGYNSQNEIRNIMEEIFATHKDYHIVTANGEKQRIRFSAGVAWFPQDSNNITDLLKLSDYAMYEAKNKRKGSVFEFNKESYRENVFLLENREAINQLIDESAIQFVFQPIVSMKTGEVFGYEALMRPLLKNFQSPLEVLAVATAESKLAQLERTIMMKAYQYVADNIALIGDRKIFINSISDQMLRVEDREFICRRYDHILDNIVIEITEEKDLSLKRLQEKVELLKQRSSMVAIDDYGAGYSNEVRILSLEPEIIKIDMAIIQGVAEDVDKQQLVENILSFCRSRGILTIAEGVETMEDLDQLLDMDVDFVQGYLLSRPKYELGDADSDVVRHISDTNRRKGLMHFM